MTVTRRYPFGPLAAAMGLSPNQAAKALSLGGYSQKEYRKLGVSELVADRLAVRAGLHPANIWPEWAADHIADAEAHGRRLRAEQERRAYQRSPSRRAKKQEWRAAYYAECGEYERQLAQRWKQQNRDRVRETRRRYYEKNKDKEKVAARERYWAQKGRDSPRLDQMTENVGREDDDGGRGVQDDEEGRLQGRHGGQIGMTVGESERADVAS